MTDLSGWAIGAVVALGLVAAVSSVLVFVVDSMARATFALLASFLAVAGILVALDLAYLAFVTALMMTIEMAIMAVFMMMFMMNPAGLMPMSMVHNSRGSAVAGAVTALFLLVGVWTIDWPTRRADRPADSTRQLGEAIMGSHMLVLILLGITLFATMIAGILLATARGRYDRFGPALDAARPTDPIPGGLLR